MQLRKSTPPKETSNSSREVIALLLHATFSLALLAAASVSLADERTSSADQAAAEAASQAAGEALPAASEAAPVASEHAHVASEHAHAAGEHEPAPAAADGATTSGAADLDRAKSADVSASNLKKSSTEDSKEPVKESKEPAKEASKKKSSHRWSDHESRLTSFMARIRSFEKEIADMIEAKHHTENSEQVRILTQQIAFKHADLAKVVKEYEAERLHVRFQHPDRDSELEREYRAHRLKSIDEIETAFGLDGRLDRIRRQVGIVFPSSEAKAAVKIRQPASVAPKKDESDMPESIHLVK